MTTHPEASPVEVTNTEPMPVAVVAGTADTTAQTTAKATAAEARVGAEILRTEDQRRISGIWERTQQIIALSVVEAALFVVSILVLTPAFTSIGGNDSDNATVTASVAGMLFLTGVANLVIGFYFGRTNHQRIGGSATDREQMIGR